MANPVLHIKDSYYFEVPKVLWHPPRKGKADFPPVWVSLDPDFQHWQFHRLHHGLSEAGVKLPGESEAEHDWEHWTHGDHARHATPFDRFLEDIYARSVAAVGKTKQPIDNEALQQAIAKSGDELLKKYEPFVLWRHDAKDGAAKWASLRSTAGDVAAYQQDSAVGEWDAHKIEQYNHHLAGKIVIPQPFGKLRNLYEKDSGFCISRFMVIEVVVAVILCVLFSWLAGKLRGSGAPKGKLWNLLETFVLFIRDQVAEPAIGHHHAHHFTPILCTLFFFVLGCNLFGMIPWTGAPTGAFGVTFGLACVTFLTVVVSGMKQFGPVGFFLNMVPGMDLPKALLLPIGGGILAIELLGLLIKHLVLSIRLLANMVAGHLVLLGVMGLAFGAHAAADFSAPDVAGWQWPVTAAIAVVGSTLFSILELFVAFLQAYIFAFLSALFIGAAIHHH